MAGLGTAGPSRQSEPAPRRKEPVTPAGPDRPRCFPAGRRQGQRRRSRHRKGKCPRPGKISGRPGASAARGRLREPTKRRKLTSRDRDKRRPAATSRQPRSRLRHARKPRTRPPPGTRTRLPTATHPPGPQIVLPERPALRTITLRAATCAAANSRPARDRFIRGTERSNDKEPRQEPDGPTAKSHRTGRPRELPTACNLRRRHERRDSDECPLQAVSNLNGAHALAGDRST